LAHAASSAPFTQLPAEFVRRRLSEQPSFIPSCNIPWLIR
jgi:hypothetical protein